MKSTSTSSNGNIRIIKSRKRSSTAVYPLTLNIVYRKESHIEMRNVVTMTKSMAFLATLLAQGQSFAPTLYKSRVNEAALYSTSEPQIFSPTVNDLAEIKSDLVRLCNRSPKPSLREVQLMVEEVEGMGEQVSHLIWSHIHTLMTAFGFVL